MKREEYDENKDRNIEEKVFVILRLFLKQSKNRRKLMATSYSWLHQYANLLVIVATHVSLTITSPWFKSFTKHDP